MIILIKKQQKKTNKRGAKKISRLTKVINPIITFKLTWLIFFKIIEKKNKINLFIHLVKN